MNADESHTLDRDVGQLLLNVSQEVLRQRTVSTTGRVDRRCSVAYDAPIGPRSGALRRYRRRLNMNPPGPLYLCAYRAQSFLGPIISLWTHQYRTIVPNRYELPGTPGNRIKRIRRRTVGLFPTIAVRAVDDRAA